MAPSLKTACLAAVAFLCACGGGGGGGDGGGESCPPGSVIGIYPPSARVTAGSAPFEFGGGVSNCSGPMASWKLTGPGSLDKTSGVPIHYTPPVSVDAQATATLTISMGGLSTSALITIDPSSITIRGRVVSLDGTPIPDIKVQEIGTQNIATTDAAGAFTMTVPVPYSLYVISEESLLWSIYSPLYRSNPTLTLFFEDGYIPTAWWPSGGRIGGYVTGTLSGGAGFPQPDMHVAEVAFHSPEVPAALATVDTQGAYSLQGSWTGPSSTTGNLHALQWAVDGDGAPTIFNGYATKSVTITVSQALTGQDLALQPVTTQIISGGMADSQSASIAARVAFSDGTWLRYFPVWGAASFVGGVGPAFNIPAPVVSNATVDLMARRDYVDRAYEEIHQHGLAPNAGNVTFTFGGLPQPYLPGDNATGIGGGSTFQWYTVPDLPVYVLSVRPDIGAPAGSPSFDVFVAGPTFTIPTGGDVLPKNAPYTWRVRASTAFMTVDDTTGPRGYMAEKASYRLSQGTSFRFTTAP